MKAIIRAIRWLYDIISSVIGRFSWTPPGWLKAIISGEKLSFIRSGVGAMLRNWKRGLLVLVGLLLIAGTAWWVITHQPEKPPKLSVSAEAPGITPLVKDARPDPLYIHFGGSAAPLEDIGKEVSEGIHLSPQMKGTWRWADDARLVFTPDEEWTIGQEYTVRFDRSMLPEHVLLEDYEVEFETEGFSARFTDSEFYQDPRDPKIKRIVATVKFTHPVNTEDFEKRVSIVRKERVKGKWERGDETLSFTVTYDEFFGEAYIQSEPVSIPPKDEYTEIIVDEGIRPARKGNAFREELSRDVTVPGVYNFFRVDYTDITLVRNEKNEPGQVLVLEMTAGVLESEIQKNISAYLLPTYKPVIPGSNRKVQRNYGWYNPDEVGPEVLALSTRVELEPIPTEDEYSKLHSFRLRADENHHLYIKLNKGIKSYGDYVMAEDYDAIVRVPKYPRELNVMSDGAILSLSGQKKVSVLSRDIEGIRFEIGRVLPGQINHLVSQSSGQFSSPYFRGYSFDENNIVERFHEIKTLRKLPHGKAQYAAFDFASYISPPGESTNRGLFFFKAEGWDPRRNRSIGVSDERLILVTDLGLLVKDSSDGTHDVFVMSISTGTPVAGARVEVLGLNGVPIVERTTGYDGHVQFPTLKDFRNEQKPTAYVVRKGRDLSFMPYDRSDRRLNTSRFDVGGVYTHGKGERLNAYLFSDRGIYRPGDRFNVGFIVKSADWKRELEGVPVEGVVSDARGLEVLSRRYRLKPEGFDEISYRTEESSPTGEYQVRLYIVKDGRRSSLLGSTTVRVEEFLPDRMKISSRFSDGLHKGWVSPEGLKAHVKLMNLYGTPAINRRVSADITLSPTYPSFPSFGGFTFFDPMKAEHRFTDRLKDTTTDENGEAVFDLALERFDRATYRLEFSAEGYEAEGGRSVLTQSSVLVSPLSYLVGYKPDGKLAYVSKDSERYVEFVAVNSDLKKTEVSGLKLKLIEQKYVSVLKKQSNNTYKYQSELKETTLGSEDFRLLAEGTKYRLPTDNVGDFVLEVVDGNDTELARVKFSVAGQENITRSLERDAELQVKLDRADYTPGEMIEIQIKAPYTGAGLITIEKEKVYAKKWFRTTTTSSIQTIRVPEELEGNGYVNVSFVRAMDSEEIYMSPLSYGIVPFSVSMESRDMKVELDAPGLVRPGDELKIKYKAARPGKIVVFAVDEGILQVAKYRTPSPLSHFFRKNALEVTTAQILDMILPEYSMVLAASTSGGGYLEREALGKNLNPFKRKRDKPVAYWSGIVDVDTTERELSYTVPDYFNGRLRVMAVAVSPDAVGAAERSTEVRGYFVLSPNVPLFVGPGDEFEISVNVANNVEDSGEGAAVRLELKTSEHLEVMGEAVRSMKIDEGREDVETFRIRANDILGSGNFTFTASHADKKSRASVDLSVRPPTPYMTRVKSGYLEKDSTQVDVTRAMYPHFRVNEAGASHLPMGLSHGLLEYLRNYPYGCTEQIVSQAFPALVLQNMPDFGYAPEKTEKMLRQVMRVLHARQNSEGAFGFWAANSHVSPFQSAYAVHFLTEAKQAGYPVDERMLERSLSYLKKLSRQKGDSLAEARASAYALYLLTRNGVVTTNDLTGLHAHLEKTYADDWKTDVTAIYLAAVYKMLKLDSKAESLIRPIRTGQETRYDYAHFYDGLVRDAQYIYILSRHFPDRLKKLEPEDILRVVDHVLDDDFNTISSSYTIIALKAYADAVGMPDADELRISEVLKEGKVRALVLPAGYFPVADFTEEAKKVQISSESRHPVFWQVTQAGFDTSPPKEKITDKLEVQREYRDRDGKVVEQATIGDELFVHIKVRAIEDDGLENIAIVDLLPGGFEVVLEPGARNNSKTTFRADYVDMREDRVLVFGRASRDAKEFVYRIRATNKGSFTVPPVFAEGMYDRSVQARSLGGRMTVEPAE